MTNKTKIQLLLSLGALLFCIFTYGIWKAVESPTLGAITARQLDDTTTSWALVSFFSGGSSFPAFIFMAALALIWFPWSRPRVNQNEKGQVFTVLSLLTLFLFTGCAPYNVPQIQEIAANETAWVIPLDANSKDAQVKFNSAVFFDQNR